MALPYVARGDLTPWLPSGHGHSDADLDAAILLASNAIEAWARYPLEASDGTPYSETSGNVPFQVQQATSILAARFLSASPDVGSGSRVVSESIDGYSYRLAAPVSKAEALTIDGDPILRALIGRWRPRTSTVVMSLPVEVRDYDPWWAT